MPPSLGETEALTRIANGNEDLLLAISKEMPWHSFGKMVA